MLFRVPKKGQLRISEEKIRPKVFREMDRNVFVISKRSKFP